DLLDERPVEQARIGAIEAAIPEDDASDLACPRDRSFQMTDGVEGAAQLPRGLGVERALLGFDGAAGPGIGPPAKALRDEALDPPRPGCGEQVIRPLGAQPVADRKGAIEVPQV